MTNRPLVSILKDQDPLILRRTQSVQEACVAMCSRRAGSVLVTDEQDRLCGIFTGRDAIRALASKPSAVDTPLMAVMTPNPITVGPSARAIDALRIMCDGGFRHVPVLDGKRICGVVSRGDFLGAEIDRLDEDEHLAECIW